MSLARALDFRLPTSDWSDVPVPDPRTHHRSPGDAPPPPGPPWDLPLVEAPLAFLDLEMTGLRIGEDRVLEVCVERVRGGVTEGRLETVVDPGERRGAEQVHGIGDAAIAGAPTFAAIADPVLELLRGAVVVAHGAIWDLAFLRDELARIGRVDDAPSHAIDTVVLSRRAFHFHGYGLQSLAKELDLGKGPAHRAGGDVATMRALFDRLVVELAPKTPRDLWEVRVGERAPRAEIVAAVESAVVGQTPVAIVYRPAHRGPERLTMILTGLVPPHAIGYLLPGRGRRELRLDRILRVEPQGAP